MLKSKCSELHSFLILRCYWRGKAGCRVWLPAAPLYPLSKGWEQHSTLSPIPTSTFILASIQQEAGVWWTQHRNDPSPTLPHGRRLIETKAFRLFPKPPTWSPSHLQSCPPQGVVQCNVILNICQLNQSSKFSSRERYVDLRCSLEYTASINSSQETAGWYSTW